MISSIIKALWYEWAKKKLQRIYELLNAKIKPNILCLSTVYNEKIFFLEKESFLRKRWGEGLNQKWKEAFFLIALLLRRLQKGPHNVYKKSR